MEKIGLETEHSKTLSLTYYYDLNGLSSKIHMLKS